MTTIPNATKRKRAVPQFVYSPAHAIIILSKLCNSNAEAGAKIGVSDSVISEACTKGHTRLVNELAAERVLQIMEGEIDDTKDPTADDVLEMLGKIATYCSKPAHLIDDRVWDIMSLSLRDITRNEARKEEPNGNV